jgi:cell division protein FtsW (lipid II flippase)
MGYILKEYPDRLIIISTILLMMIGLVFVYSVSGPYVQFLNRLGTFYTARHYGP